METTARVARLYDSQFKWISNCHVWLTNKYQVQDLGRALLHLAGREQTLWWVHMPNLSRPPPHMFTSTYNRALHQLTTDSPKFDNGHPYYPTQCHVSLFCCPVFSTHYSKSQSLLQKQAICYSTGSSNSPGAASWYLSVACDHFRNDSNRVWEWTSVWVKPAVYFLF